MSEVTVQAGGELWLVPASGSGRTLATAAGAVPVLVGFVQSFSFQSGVSLTIIKERGRPNHAKISERKFIPITVTFLSTANAFPTAVTGAGASVPMWHGELIQTRPHVGANSAMYQHFFGIAAEDMVLTEKVDGNTIDLNMRALAMGAPTASGYLRQATSFGFG